MKKRSRLRATASIQGMLLLMLFPLLHCHTDPGIAPPSVRIEGGDPANTEWVDITLTGKGLARFEGKPVYVHVGTRIFRADERQGYGRGIVENGAFHFDFPKVMEADLYKTSSVAIDMDGNSRCSPGVDWAGGRVFEANLAPEPMQPWDFYPVDSASCTLLPEPLWFGRLNE